MARGIRDHTACDAATTLAAAPGGIQRAGRQVARLGYNSMCRMTPLRRFITQSWTAHERSCLLPPPAACAVAAEDWSTGGRVACPHVPGQHG